MSANSSSPEISEGAAVATRNVATPEVEPTEQEAGHRMTGSDESPQCDDVKGASSSEAPKLGNHKRKKHERLMKRLSLPLDTPWRPRIPAPVGSEPKRPSSAPSRRKRNGAPRSNEQNGGKQNPKPKRNQEESEEAASRPWEDLETSLREDLETGLREESKLREAAESRLREESKLREAGESRLWEDLQAQREDLEAQKWFQMGQSDGNQIRFAAIEERIPTAGERTQTTTVSASAAGGVQDGSRGKMGVRDGKKTAVCSRAGDEEERLVVVGRAVEEEENLPQAESAQESPEEGGKIEKRGTFSGENSRRCTVLFYQDSLRFLFPFRSFQVSAPKF